MSKSETSDLRFAICLRNDGYPAALECRKLYRVLPDPEASGLGQLRVIDESGEDYLYPAEFFADVDLPRAVEEALLLAS
jgi:hypothetical protein